MIESALVESTVSEEQLVDALRSPAAAAQIVARSAIPGKCIDLLAGIFVMSLVRDDRYDFKASVKVARRYRDDVKRELAALRRQAH